MTYATVETSASDGAPVELYTFSYTGHAFRYTSADEEIIVDGIAYAPLALTRSALRPSINKEKSGLTLSLPLSAPLCELFRIAPPGEEVELTVARYHRGDGQRLVVYIGRVVNARFDQFEMELSVESIMSSMQRTILTRSYQKNCPHLLYGTACKADPTAYRVNTVATTITGNIVLAPISPADDYYAGGVIAYTGIYSGVTERRFIVGNTGGQFTLDRSPYGLLEGQAFNILPGCKRTMDDCKNKFNNLANYGGQPFIPTKNPVGGAPIY